MKYTDPSDQLSDEDSDEQDGLHVVDTEERVREAMASLRIAACEITITSLPTDIEEGETTSSFMASGCGCSKVNGKPCSFSKGNLR